jgi:enoyl-CoA hydratase/carnithine racemase
MATVMFSTDGDLGTITVDNPPLNLLTEEMIDDFEKAVTQASRAPIRSLLLHAEGPHFMAGADMALFEDRSADQARALFARAIPAVTRLEELPVPTVVAVQGFCVTAGLELALLADIAVAGESARFAQAERRIGTTTLLGGAQRLVERAGRREHGRSSMTATSTQPSSSPTGTSSTTSCRTTKSSPAPRGWRSIMPTAPLARLPPARRSCAVRSTEEPAMPTG